MKDESVGMRLLPVDLAGLVACSKVTGLSVSQVARHFLRLGVEASANDAVGDLRARILDGEARALGRQLAVNDAGGPYTLDVPEAAASR